MGLYIYHNKAAYIKFTLNNTEILTTQLIEKLHINIKKECILCVPIQY